MPGALLLQERASDPLKLGFQTVVSHHAGDENFGKSSKCSSVLSHLSSPREQFVDKRHSP